MVNIFPVGQSGAEDITEGLPLGTNDFQATSPGVSGTFIKPVDLLNLPFPFKGPNRGVKVISGAIGVWITTECVREEEKFLGIRGPCCVCPRTPSAPSPGLTTSRACRSAPGRCRCTRKRTRPRGRGPVPPPSGELYTALQTGVVDGDENGPATLEAMGLYGARNHVTYPLDVSKGDIPLMSLKTWQRRSADLQQEVVESAKAWVESMDNEGLKQDTEALKKREAKGTKINTSKDLTPQVNATRHIYDQMLKDLPRQYRDTVDKILLREWLDGVDLILRRHAPR